ncbi:hypothetical protein A8E25_35615 [Burkholderia cenocepacia]|nr:hypothetical protein A8D61_22570 [Burkholderia cenocepacia]AQQ43141.1 hypothetical protein A8E75_29955 [Burkholderia cenocepacia]AQQ50499.1 hypothetical protein A8F32_33065 [Burkholderia cenocepacia]ARF85525.1 uncharacterized protein BCN122_I2138 [Burkholderia cenocepacia]NDV72450.1 hypothetical protein [Burkholderia cenocepacia]
MHFIRRAGDPARRRPDRITRSKVCFLCHSSAALRQRRAGMTQIPPRYRSLRQAGTNVPDSLRCV